MASNRTVVFVMGGGHCGSTLLDLLLGSHSQAFSLGELKSLANHDPGGTELCGICPAECPFWNHRVPKNVLKRTFAGGRSQRAIVRMLYTRFGGLTVDLYGHLAEAAGVRVLVDSSKSIWWIRRQVRALGLHRSAKAYLIHMTRDGRAVTNSYLRKYPERGMEKIATEWARDTLKREAFFRTFPEARRMVVAYESLASHPESTARELCDGLDLDFEPEMLRYWLHDHHLVGGNLGTRSLIFKYREEFDSALAEHWQAVNKDDVYADSAYYGQVGLAIRFDDRWRDELTPDHLAAFQRVAGDLNVTYAAGQYPE